MKRRRPSVFIGSSAEGLRVAEAIQLNLDFSCDVTIWSQGVFGLGGGTLESLADSVDNFDFSILVLSPDDLVVSREKAQQSPRDNVLLELGLFIGAIGRKRTFVVYDRHSNLKLPTDMAGVTPATYQLHNSGELQPSLGAACTQIKAAITQQGLRPNLSSDFEISQFAQFQVICDLLDEPAKQIIIAMHLFDKSIRRKESTWGAGLYYIYGTSNHSIGQGFFSIDSFCNKLADANLITIDLRFNIRLTVRGHDFAKWLMDTGKKSTYFGCIIGTWGQVPDTNLFPDEEIQFKEYKKDEYQKQFLADEKFIP